jgi:hypothetical protein
MKILFEDGVCEEVEVTELSPGGVRLEETPLASASEVYFGDEIELERGEHSVWRFLRVSKRRDHQSVSIPLGSEVADSEELRSILAAVAQQGVHWERAFGGILFLHGPAEEVARARTRIAALTAGG